VTARQAKAELMAELKNSKPSRLVRHGLQSQTVSHVTVFKAKQSCAKLSNLDAWTQQENVLQESKAHRVPAPLQLPQPRQPITSSSTAQN
jgi:hypothetical protein